MAEHKHINVLYVDNEHHNLLAFKSNFRRDFEVFCADSKIEAEKILSQNLIHVIITEEKIAGKTGINFLAECVNAYPSATRILVSTFGNKQTLIEAINLAQVYRYIEKPWDHRELQAFILDGYTCYKRNLQQT